MYPLSATLDAYARFLPAALVPPAALEAVRGAAARLPAALSHRLCLECRLAEGAEGTDLICGVEAAGADILGAERAGLAPDLAALEPWTRVRELCRLWRAPHALPAAALERVWLEFDAPPPGARGAPPVPGVFVDLTPWACSHGSPERRCAVALEVLAALLGSALPPEVAEGVLRCQRALPPGARIPYLGVLLPRGTDRVRLCVAGLGAGRLEEYLAAAGWPAFPALREALDGLETDASGRPVPAPALLHLDVGGGGPAAVGLELAFPRRPQVRGELPGGRLLDALVERGLCAPARRDALRAWPGCSVERLPHELWSSVALRHLAHVKLVLEPERVREAKAYLSLLHLPRRRGAAIEPRLYRVEPALRALRAVVG